MMCGKREREEGVKDFFRVHVRVCVVCICVYVCECVCVCVRRTTKLLLEEMCFSF